MNKYVNIYNSLDFNRLANIIYKYGKKIQEYKDCLDNSQLSDKNKKIIILYRESLYYMPGCFESNYAINISSNFLNTINYCAGYLTENCLSIELLEKIIEKMTEKKVQSKKPSISLAKWKIAELKELFDFLNENQKEEIPVIKLIIFYYYFLKNEPIGKYNFERINYAVAIANIISILLYEFVFDDKIIISLGKTFVNNTNKIFSMINEEVDINTEQLISLIEMVISTIDTNIKRFRLIDSNINEIANDVSISKDNCVKLINLLFSKLSFTSEDICNGLNVKNPTANQYIRKLLDYRIISVLDEKRQRGKEYLSFVNIKLEKGDEYD